MNILLILLFISVLISGGFLIALLWSIKSDQFEDEAGAARRALFDETSQKQ